MTKSPLHPDSYCFIFVTAADVYADQLEQSEETRRSGRRWCRGHDFHFVSFQFTRPCNSPRVELIDKVNNPVLGI